MSVERTDREEECDERVEIEDEGWMTFIEKVIKRFDMRANDASHSCKILLFSCSFNHRRHRGIREISKCVNQSVANRYRLSPSVVTKNSN